MAHCALCQQQNREDWLKISSHTRNTVTKLKVNYKHNLVSLQYELPTSVMNIEYQSFFKMATFALHTFPKSLWPPIYCIMQCLLQEICHCFQQGPLQDFDVGVPRLTDHAFKHCPLLESIGLRSELLKGQSPGVIESGKLPRARPWQSLPCGQVPTKCCSKASQQAPTWCSHRLWHMFSPPFHRNGVGGGII